MSVNPPTISPDGFVPGTTAASAATLELWGALPQFVQDADAANQYTFLSWLEGIGGQQQLIDNLCRDSEFGPGWSAIVDLGRCPSYALPWLAQFVGVNLPGSILSNDEATRQAILAHPGFNRGTVAAIIDAAQSLLGPNSYVNVIERYPDPYSLTVQYYDNNGSLTYSELAVAEPTYAAVDSAYATYNNFPVQSGDAVAAAIQSAIPGGLICTIIDAG